MITMRLFPIFFCQIFIFSPLFADSSTESWAVQTLQSMSIEEKIGQLFMIPGYVCPVFAQIETDHLDMIKEIDRLISDYHIGGINFVGRSDPLKQAALTNHYQELSKYPLLIAQDLEWGLSMRHPTAMQFPKNITLGAINDNTLIYEMGKEIGRQARLIGVNMNLSPVLDVNTQTENVVINVRSFGSDPQSVAEKGVAMIKGLQESQVIASAKHFPGLGSIKKDPHLELPSSTHSAEELIACDLYPFMEAIKADVMSIQTEHILLPCLEEDPRTPASQSKTIIQHLLIDKLGFKGLVISGALRMKALTNHFTEETIVLEAFFAGHDLLLMPQNLPRAYEAIRNAFKTGLITLEDIEKRVLKILKLKEWVKLHLQKIIQIPRLEDLNTDQAKQLQEKLYSSVITFRSVLPQLLPIKHDQNIAYVQLGDSSSSQFFDQLNKVLHCDPFNLSPFEENKDLNEELMSKITDYPLIILAVHPLDPRRIVELRQLSIEKLEGELDQFRVHGMTKPLIKMVNNLKNYQHKIIVVNFGNPFSLPFFADFSLLLQAYEDNPIAQETALKTLFNQIVPKTLDSD